MADRGRSCQGGVLEVSKGVVGTSKYQDGRDRGVKYVRKGAGLVPVEAAEGEGQGRGQGSNGREEESSERQVKEVQDTETELQAISKLQMVGRVGV
eukprot:749941-Hanusia_phi.AAC.2